MDEPLLPTPGGYSLSLAAAAFFVGYGLELALKTIDTLIEGALTRLKRLPEPEKVVPIAPAAK